MAGPPSADVTAERRVRATLPPAGALFLCLFASQAALIAVSPVLAEVARDFDVSTAAAGQLRSVSGLVAGFAAVGMGRLTRRLGLRDLLIAGLVVLAAGSLLSALAPSFEVLAAAQVAVGAGVAVVLAGGLAAAAEWTSPERRSHALSWALVGQPAAWIVGMPVIGLVGDWSWRWGWIAVPLAASLAALAVVAPRVSDAPTETGTGGWRLLREDLEVAGWAAGELLAFSAWAGTLVYAGALYVESYGASPGTAGVLLGLAAVAYLPGNFIARRWAGEPTPRAALVVLPLIAAGLVAVFGAYRPELWVSAAVLSVLAFVGGARTMIASARGLEVCAHRRLFGMRLRAGATQFGYLLGSALGGVALATAGYPGMGWCFAALFVLAALPHLFGSVPDRRLSRRA